MLAGAATIDESCHRTAEDESCNVSEADPPRKGKVQKGLAISKALSVIRYCSTLTTTTAITTMTATVALVKDTKGAFIIYGQGWW